MLKYILLAMAIGLIGLGLGASLTTNPTYSGKETFQSVEAYSEFKIVMGNPEVKILEFNSLSSAPPIVVSYKVNTPRDMNFPYGVKSWESAIINGVLGGGFGVGFLVIALIFFKESNKEVDDGQL